MDSPAIEDATSFPEIFYVSYSFFMFKKMLFNYILPITQRIFGRNPTNNRAIQNLKFNRNRRNVASHVKNVFEKVKVFVVSDAGLCNDIVEKRMTGRNDVNFIGLDCEWDSSKKNGVALLQISSGNDCILYRTMKTNGVIPDKLKELLEDRKILKFGVAVQEDVRRLRSHGVNVRGFVDLRNVAQRCLPQPSELSDGGDELFQWTSLRSLSYNALEMKLSKNYHIRCGDWEASTLNQQQVLYAAKDAIVSLEIFYALILLRKLHRVDNFVLNESFVTEVENITEWSSQRYFTDLLETYSYCHTTDQISELDARLPSAHLLSKPSPWLKELAYSLCQGIVETNHKYKPPATVLKKSKGAAQAFSRGLSTKANSKKEYSHQCRDKPLYENCFLTAPDKRVLATVNRSKAQWYVHKELGVVECEEPFTVRLLFEPSGRPMPDADYYTTVKDNLCVVCGGKENFVRKMVIPHDYRKYFPQHFKDHMSHDVLLMCLNCHRIAQQGDEAIRQELAQKYNAPLGTKERMMFIDNPDLSKVRSAAKALRYGGDKIPQERRNVLEEIVKKYHKVDQVTQEMLEKTVEINVKVENRKFEGLHGERVVKKVIEENGLEDFVKMWRQNFLDYMQPKYLPEMWSVEHNLHKLTPNFVENVNKPDEQGFPGHPKTTLDDENEEAKNEEDEEVKSSVA